MTVKAVVFDLDGTIASFNLDYMAVRAEVRGFLIRSGLPASILVTNESMFEMLKKAEIFMKNNGKSDKAIQKVRNEALAMAEKHELEAARSTSTLPGVVETLKELKKMKLKIGLCTINSEKATNYILNRFDLANFFDAVIPRDKVKYVKPNAEHLEAVLEALDVKPNNTVVVGDGKTDMKCAKELNAIAVGLPTGLASEKELMDYGADYLITMVSDVPTLIEKINESGDL